jgi:oligoribonuclease
MSVDGYIFCDLETTGLVAQDEVILEIGFALYDRKLEHVESKSWLVLTHDVYQFINSELHDDEHKFVKNMHTGNGLLEDLNRGFNDEIWNYETGMTYRDRLVLDILSLLDKWGVEKSTPMCGSSPRMDRAFLEYHLPEIDSKFSYRIIDASSFMEFLRIQNPDQLEADMEKVKAVRSGAHRVLTDIHSSVNTLRALAGMEPVAYDH